MSDAKDLVAKGIQAITGEFKAKVQSKKFYAYLVANLMLILTIFTIKPDGDTVIGFLKLINIGYFGTQGGIDAIKAGSALFEKRQNGKAEDTEG